MPLSRRTPAAPRSLPVYCTPPEVDGARFALAGLSTAAGESHLHVISSGMPPLAERFAYDWTPGFS